MRLCVTHAQQRSKFPGRKLHGLGPFHLVLGRPGPVLRVKCRPYPSEPTELKLTPVLPEPQVPQLARPRRTAPVTWLSCAMRLLRDLSGPPPHMIMKLKVAWHALDTKTSVLCTLEAIGSTGSNRTSTYRFASVHRPPPRGTLGISELEFGHFYRLTSRLERQPDQYGHSLGKPWCGCACEVPAILY